MEAQIGERGEEAVVKSVHGTDRWTQDDDVNAPVQEDGGHRWPLPEQFKSIRQKADCYGSRNSQGRRKMKLSVGHLVPRPVEKTWSTCWEDENCRTKRRN